MANLSNINNKFLVTTGGNVGIGDTGPSTRLTVDVPAILNNTVNIFQLGDDTNGLVFKKFWNASGIAWRLNKGVSGINMMTFSQDGKVGIGTDSPATKLHVSGSIRIDNGASFTSYQIYRDNIKYGDVGGGSNQFTIQAANNKNINLFDDSGVGLTVKDGGNVGIGTTSPDTTLEVKNPTLATDTVNTLLTQRWSRSQTGAVKWGNSMDLLLGSYESGTINSRTRVDFKLANGATDDPDTTVMTLQANGNVGIGTTSPGSKLEIAGANSTTNATALFSIQKNEEGYGLFSGLYGSGASWLQSGTADGTTDYSIVMQPNGGNVGIGTQTPLSTLSIKGGSEALRFERDSQETYRVLHGTSGLYFSHPNSGALLLGLTQNGDITVSNDQSAEYVRFDNSSSNVGIGTTAPSYKLDVAGEVRANNLFRTTDGTNIGLFGSSVFASNVIGIGSSNAVPLVLGTAATERMRIDSAGNVGIGTTAPSQKLDVNGNIGLSGNGTGNRWILLNETNTYAGTLRIQAGGGSAGYGGAINMYGHSHATNPGDVAVGISNGSGGSFRVNSTGIDTGTDLFIVKSSGNVGIGTVSPTEKLHIKSTTSGSFIRFEDNGGSGVYVGSRSDDLEFYAGNSEKMVILSGGNVGIGTTSPGYKLDVAGTTRVTGELRLGSNVNQYSGDFNVWVSNVGQAFTVKQNTGNVGIGVIAPARILEVSSGTAALVRISATDTSPGYSAVEFRTNGSNYAYVGTEGGTGGQLFIGTTAFATILGNTGAVPIQFATNNNVRATIDSSGNVGIGTTSPSKKLDIAGDVKLTNSNSIYWRNAANNADIPLLNLSSNNTFNIGTTSSSVPVQMALHTAGSERMRITSTGNVGIGTTSPDYKLEVEGASGTAISIKTPWAGGAYGELRFQTGTGNSSIRSSVPGNSTNGLDFYTYNGSETVKMSIIGNGNVGIGTTGPAEKLSVYNSTAISTVGDALGAYVAVASPQANRGAAIRIGRDPDGSYSTKIATVYEQSSPSYLNPAMVFYTMNNSYIKGTEVERLRITSAGNVGIGTTSPVQKLEVSGNTYVTGYVQASSALIGLKNGYATLGSNSTATGIALSRDFLPSSYPDLIINSAGNVGIGTTAPSYKLDVSGTIRATADVIAYSDARVKENIKTIDNALEKTTKLRGVSYIRNDIEDKSTKIGVIAQEVLEVLPEVVSKDDEGKYSVSYGNIVGVLIEAIKELKADNDSLKARIETLENK
jgi:hypothetical protein